MKKTTFAGIVSICMVPALFWSTEGSAIPSWARKYQVSCYMCHSGMPQRNAVGEAFKNNGYRMPANAEAAFAKQKDVKIGTNDWAKGVHSPVSGSFPQFDPLSVVLTGNIVNYKGETHNLSTNAIVAKKEFNIAASNAVSLFYGATIGDNFGIFGEIGGFGSAYSADSGGAIDGSKITSMVRAVYQFSPGFNLAVGNSFSNASYNGVAAGGVANTSSVLPAPLTYAELNFTRGETGGYSIVAGTSMAANYTTPINADNSITDMLYLRGKLKLIGAGLLSGANGEFGNQYNGLDNQLSIGAGLSYSNKKNVYDATGKLTSSQIGFTGNYATETLVYGADIQGVYQDFLVGAAYSRDRDLKLDNFRVEAGYFVYPWLFAKVGYVDIANASKHMVATTISDTHQPQVIPSISWFIAPNISLTSTYTINTKSSKVNGAFNESNQNTFALAVRAGF